jgi:hypothetical protein
MCCDKVYAVQNYSLQNRKDIKVGLDGVKSRSLVENTELKLYLENSLRTPSLAGIKH